MTHGQTTLTADVFGDALRDRVERAERTRQRVLALAKAFHTAGWQTHPWMLDAAYHQASAVLHDPHTEDALQALELAEDLTKMAETYL